MDAAVRRAVRGVRRGATSASVQKVELPCSGSCSLVAAVALFFAGMSTKLGVHRLRVITLAIGCVLFLGTAIRHRHVRGQPRALGPCAPMPTIVTLPGDGIGPEVLAAALELPRRRRPRPHLRGAPDRRRRDRRHRHRAARRDARGRQARRRRPARRRRRPEVGHHRPRQAAAGAGPARPAPGPRPVREPAPGPPAAGALRRQPAQAARSSSAPTCSSCAS